MYIFDFDGTLLDSNQVWEDIDQDFLAQRGIHPVPDSYTDFVCHHGFYESAVYTKDCFDLQESPEEIVDIWREMGRTAYGQTLPLKAGAKELLQRLKGTGEGIVLLTSCMPELCHLALERHGISEFFDVVYTTAELEIEKRNPEIYRHVASLHEISPADCIFFDDAPAYCSGAKEAGMTVIGVKDDLYAHRRDEMKIICNQYLESLLDYK